MAASTGGWPTFLPGFRQFRYPAKLFTFATLALAALAGMGWDAPVRGARRRITALTATLLAVTVVALMGVLWGRDAILSRFSSANLVSLYGPFDPKGGYEVLVRSLVHASAVLGVGLLAIRLAASRPWLAGILVLVASTADLALANARYVITVPQATFEETPELLRVIQQAERDDPAPGPYRVHRLPSWEPAIWRSRQSDNRSQEVVAWELATLQPKYGIPHGVQYAHVLGVAELMNTNGSSGASSGRSGTHNSPACSISRKARKSSIFRDGLSTCGTSATSSFRSGTTAGATRSAAMPR